MADRRDDRPRVCTLQFLLGARTLLDVSGGGRGGSGREVQV